MNNQKMLLGLFAGVAVGAAIGVLFAPEKGSDIRKKISTKGNDYKNNLKDKFGNLVESASEKVDSVKSKFSDLTGQAEEALAGAGMGSGSRTGATATSGSGSTGNSGAGSSMGAGSKGNSGASQS